METAMGTKLKRSDVAQRYRVSTRTIERWECNPKYAKLGFPKAVRYGLRSPLYDSDDLDAWDRKREELPGLDESDITDIIQKAAE
jgi:hypothetical protein